MTGLPLERTSFPGVYRRGSPFVVVYRSGGRQRKQAAATLADARAIKLARDAEARGQRYGPTLHGYALMIDGDLGPALDLRKELRSAQR